LYLSFPYNVSYLIPYGKNSNVLGSLIFPDNEESIADEATKVIEEAFKFCDEELAKYDDEDDE